MRFRPGLSFSCLSLCAVAFSAAVQAGDHYHFYSPGPVMATRPVFTAGHTVTIHSATVVQTVPASYPSVVHVTPVAYAAPVVAYQPAYVVPMSTVMSVSPSATVTYSSVYAPMVPVVSRVHVPVYRPRSYSLRPAYYAPVYSRQGRPRDVEIEIDYRRDGGYRYEVDFD